MTDVPSKHVWKIKESRIVFKDFDIIAVVSTFWNNERRSSEDRG